MNSDRNEQIVYLLVNYKTMLISQLCEKFSTSEKTIIRAVSSINLLLKKYKLFVEVNNGQLNLIGDTKLIWEKLNEEKEIFTKYERLIYLFNHFLKTDEKTTISDLSLNLEVPVTQIKNDFKDLNNILKKYKLDIRVDEKLGFTIELDNESQKNAVFVELIFLYFLSKQIASFVKTQNVKMFFNSYIYKILKNHYQIENFNQIYFQLTKVIKEEEIKWSEIDTLLLAMLITIWIKDENNNRLLEKNSKEEVWDIKNIIANLNVSKDEHNLLQRFNKRNVNLEYKGEIENCIQDIEQLLKNLLGKKPDFENEIILNMTNHLQNSLMDKNNKYDLQIKNFISGIQNYIDKYSYLWNSLNRCINKYFLQQNNNSQITYGIFIYIIVWLDSQLYKMPMKILTVCIGGMGQSKMLASHLKTIYKRANIEAMPFAFINQKILKDYDLVISSIEITESEFKNTLHLPVIFSVENKNIIHEKLSEIFFEQKIEKRWKEMQKILEKENIVINLPSEPKENAIIRAGEKLVELGYVKPEYIKSMIKREKKITTYIGNKIAIPHGEDGSQSLILKSGIVIMHYKEPVEFDGPVNFIIAIASNNNLHLEILSNIAEKFCEIEKVEELLANPSVEMFYDEFKLGE